MLISPYPFIINLLRWVYPWSLFPTPLPSTLERFFAGVKSLVSTFKACLRPTDGARGEETRTWMDILFDMGMGNRENGGKTLGMVPFVINLIYAWNYNGCLLGISPFKALFGVVKQQRALHPKGTTIFSMIVYLGLEESKIWQLSSKDARKKLFNLTLIYCTLAAD